MRTYPKFTQRVLQCKTNATVRRVQTLSAIPYSHLRQREYSSGEEISIAISVVAFNGELRFLQESLDSLLCQSHQALEIIIIDNGTTGQHRGLVNEAFHADPRVVLLRFPQHYFLPAAPDETNSWPIMANAALFATDCFGFFPCPMTIKLIQTTPTAWRSCSNRTIFVRQRRRSLQVSIRTQGSTSHEVTCTRTQPNQLDLREEQMLFKR